MHAGTHERRRWPTGLLPILLLATNAAFAQGPPGTITAQQLLDVTSNCTVLPGSSNFRTKNDSPPPGTVPICKLSGAIWWRADMDIDCDGKRTAVCNETTDPAFQRQTSLTDSSGSPLDASILPFVVVPNPSNGFDYAAHGIFLGVAVAVIYNGQLRYGVFADTGPEGLIGEASYAMASSFGIDPDPRTGGEDSGVTYIVFTGQNAVISPPESNDQANVVGDQRAQDVVNANSMPGGFNLFSV